MKLIFEKSQRVGSNSAECQILVEGSKDVICYVINAHGAERLVEAVNSSSSAQEVQSTVVGSQQPSSPYKKRGKK